MYVDVNGKKLRCGYTTGSCSAGAAKAATMILFSKIDNLSEIEIASKKDVNIIMPIESIKIFKDKDYVECTILKDGGDDPDRTHGIEIIARVKKLSKDEFSFKLNEKRKKIKDFSSDFIEFNELEEENIILKGGEGVGIVSKDGLFVKKGQPAINPVPQKMIKDEVMKVLPDGEKVEVTIIVPQGREIAKKTFNPRLGIVNGISILGTTGIVFPMSEDAIKASIQMEIKQKSINNKKLVLTFGNLGDNYCRKLGYGQDEIVICSNYIGFALETCVSCNVKSVVVVGHIGKMCKIAYGCFNTHSRVCGVRLEVMALELAILGYDISLINDVLNESTCEGAVKLLGEGFDKLYENITQKIVNKISEYVYKELRVDAIMYYGASSPVLLYDSTNSLFSGGKS